MSKRKNRSSSPNIPQETLERARRQLAGEAVDTTPPVEEKPVEEKPTAPPPMPRATPVSPTTRSTRSQRRSAEGGVSRRSRQPEMLTTDILRERLEHPTKIVTEDELRQEYSYVLKDLQSMGLLAAALAAALVVIAQLL